MEKISFVIPCYCSSNTVESVVNEIEAAMKPRGDDYDHEIILVNDYSTDNTEYVIMQLCKYNSKVKGLSFSRNFGQHSAVMAGFSCATGHYIVNLDDDGQTPVDHVFHLLDKIEEGYDIVFARYNELTRRNIIRRVGTHIKETMNHYLLGKPNNIVFNSFFIARKFVIDEVLNYKNPYPYLGGLLIRATTNIANVEVPHRPRMHGKSTYTITKLIRIMLNEFTSFSVKPLRIASVIGIIFSFIGFVSAIFVVINKIVKPDVSTGWSSLISVLLFIGGIQMIIMGLIGEYIGRIYEEVKERPMYIIAERIDGEN